jgi:hypothetical protein
MTILGSVRGMENTQKVSDPEDATLAERTRALIRDFEREEKDYAFNDGGDGTMYAEWFADLLREWLARG